MILYSLLYIYKASIVVVSNLLNMNNIIVFFKAMVKSQKMPPIFLTSSILTIITINPP